MQSSPSPSSSQWLQVRVMTARVQVKRVYKIQYPQFEQAAKNNNTTKC